MSKNILMIIGSPRGKRSNSNTIARSMEEKLSTKDVCCSKVFLSKEIHNRKQIVDRYNTADIVMIFVPVYENSAPSIMLEFMEIIHGDKEHLDAKKRKIFAVANSGFPEVEASKYLIKAIKLFAEDMDSEWLGGIAVAPGTLIKDGKLGGRYKKLNLALSILADDMERDRAISDKVFYLVSKPFILPKVYRLGSKLVQRKTIKELSKTVFYAMPLK